MSGVKITPADAAFSLCVRERANWTCERCLRQTPSDKRMGLHCSHWIGRGSWGVRFHPLNAFAHCYGCHAYFEGRPAVFNDWVIERHGTQVCDALRLVGNKPAYGIKKGKAEIAKFYRAEHALMLKARSLGEGGWLPFDICPLLPDFDVLETPTAEWQRNHVS